MIGEVPLALKEKVTSMNKICTDNKLPFSIDNEIFKGNKQMVLNPLMSTLPMECFNYENVETMNEYRNNNHSINPTIDKIIERYKTIN